MTPNKLPPLPELDANAQHAWQFTAAQMHAYAAEAIRQSQSLPAGAVGDIADEFPDWCKRRAKECRDDRNEYDAQMFDEAAGIWRELTAPQADAREKGAAGITADWIIGYFPAGDEDAALSIRSAFTEWRELATQPAQASEKDNG